MTRNPKIKQPIPTVTDEILTVPDAMRIICPRKELVSALKRISGIAPKRSTMPILGNVAIRASKTGVVLAVTDLDVTGIVEIGPTWVHSPGSVTVNMKALLDTLGKLAGDDVTITAKLSGVEITCGTATVTLQGLPARDFPKLPAVLGEDPVVPWTKLSAPDVRETLAAVEFAICQDETRFHLNGVFVEYDGAKLTCVATDGHRLAKAQREISREGDFATSGVIVPARAVKQLHRLLGKGECHVALGKLGAHGVEVLAVKYGNTTICTKLIDAQFPPYEQVIPKNNARLMTVEKAALKGALERAKLTCTETRGVRLEMHGETLTLASDNPDTGETRETLLAECVALPAGKSFQLGANPKYLLDAIGEIDDAQVTLSFSDDERKLNGGDPHRHYQCDPFLVRSMTDAVSASVAQASFLCVVMPMRL